MRGVGHIQDRGPCAPRAVISHDMWRQPVHAAPPPLTPLPVLPRQRTAVDLDQQARQLAGRESKVLVFGWVEIHEGGLPAGGRELD
jgi:hypothetical protein